MKRAILGISIVLAAAILGGCEQKAAQQDAIAPETAANPNAALTQSQDWAAAEMDQGTLVEEGLTGEGAALPPETMAGQTSGAFVKPAVEEIQQALKNLNFYQGNVDGKVGPKTKQAIKDFQTQNNLTVDGKVGPRTWSMLAPYVNSAPADEATADATSN